MLRHSLPARRVCADCGYFATASACSGRFPCNDVDGRVDAEAFFGYDLAQSCSGNSGNQGCPFIVAAGGGPKHGDLWCRKRRLFNDAQHLCKHDASRFCHVVTFRVGMRNSSSYLRVDEDDPDTNANPLPARSAAFFGGSTAPSIDTTHLSELIAYDFEMSQACTNHIHMSLIAKHMAPSTRGLGPSPPPPPPTTAASTCDAHVPWVHGVSPRVTVNTGGSFAGGAITQRTALHRGEWTVFLVVANSEHVSRARTHHAAPPLPSLRETVTHCCSADSNTDSITTSYQFQPVRPSPDPVRW